MSKKPGGCIIGKRVKMIDSLTIIFLMKLTKDNMNQPYDIKVIHSKL